MKSARAVRTGLAAVAVLIAGLGACKTYRAVPYDAGPDSIDVQTPDANGNGDRPAAADGGGSDVADVDASMDAPDSKGGSAALTIDSAAHDFGIVVTGTTSADATFVVTNPGTAASASLSAALSDAAKTAGFSIKTDHCSGMSLGGGSSCQIVVVLVPASAGSPAGDLTISGGTGVSLTAHLTATAILPGALRISPDTQSFGMVAQNQGSSSQTFTITNGGQQTTGAMTVALGGTDKAEFQVTADGCGKQTLALGTASCQITVRFAPSGLGAKSASLTVSASPGGTAVAQLSGTGITQGTLTITPSTKDFGMVQQMMLGATQIFSVQNTGQATTAALTTTLAGDDNPNFSVVANNCNGHILMGGDICSVTIQFAPVTPGSKLVSLSVTGGAGQSGVAQLTGLALANATITIDPGTKSFNQVTVNQTASATFLVSNGGGVVTAVPTVTVAGATSADAGQFSIPTGSNGCTAAIVPGTPCMITVRFSPTSMGVKNGTLTVTAGTGVSATATLTGTGAAPGKLSISPLNQDFGSLAQGSKGTTPVTFTVTNTGASPTGTLQASIVGSTEFQIMGDTCSTKTLGVPGSCTVAVIFAPTTAAPSGTLQIVATNPADSTSAALSGTGLGPPKLTITPTSASFSDTVVNQANPTTASFTIRNGGGVAAGTTTGLMATISGANAADFAISTALSTCTGTLAAGAPCTVVVSFAPKTVGASKTASLNVVASPGGTAVAALGGNGISAAALGLAPASNNSATFGSVFVGDTKTQTFVVSNSGQQPSTGLSITLAKSAGPDFSLLTGASNDCVANAVVPGNSSCNLRVQFAPKNGGMENASLSVSAATGGTPAGLALTATGQLRVGISASPSTVALNTVTTHVLVMSSVIIVNGDSVATSVPVISNGNTAELTVSGCTTVLTAVGTAGASCTLLLGFTASTIGARSATVKVSVTNSSTMFTVTATGVDPCGGSGQACCTGATPCNGTTITCSAVTSPSKCVACGGSGQPCCGGVGGTCTASGAVCGTGATCVAPTGNGVACDSNPQCAGANCAQCGNANCTSRICCAAGQSNCNGSCVPLLTDNSNCGRCGNVCTAGTQTCTNGTCLLNDAQPCTNPAQCVTNSCPLCYPDKDGDGFGDKWATPTGVCGPSCPTGLIVDHRDCLDNPASPDAVQVNPNAALFPDGTNPTVTRHAYTPDPRDTSPNGWDWNCDGVVEKLFQQAVCGTPSNCTTTFIPYPDSACGSNVPPQTCMVFDSGAGGLICITIGTGPNGLQCN